MGLVSLPLHIWDRELDSRILLSALALSDNHQVILGHEQNISPIYKNIGYIFHYGAGRPVFNEPVQINGMSDVAGSDLFFFSGMSFPGMIS